MIDGLLGLFKLIFYFPLDKPLFGDYFVFFAGVSSKSIDFNGRFIMNQELGL